MDLLTVLCSFVVLIVTVYIIRAFIVQRKMPPGPPVFPIIGSTPFIQRPYWRWAISLREKYPDIMCFAEADTWIVMLNSYDAAYEAFVKKGDIFSGRLSAKLISESVNNNGFSLNDGKHWMVHRRLALHTLRDLGFGKARSQELIQEEAGQLVDEFKITQGVPTSTATPVAKAVSNIICSLIFGDKLGTNDTEFEAQLANLNEVAQQDNAPGFIVRILMPIICNVPLLHYCFASIRELRVTIKSLLDFCQIKIDEHRQTFDPQNIPRDYIDDFLLQQHQADKDTRNNILRDDHLCQSISDLFLAGTDTTTNTLRWALLYMAVHEDIQKQVHEELDNVLQDNESVSMANKKDMPLMDAVIEETHRLCMLVPQALDHRATQSGTLLGYHIPKDAILVPNIAAIHSDKAVFPDPHLFNPNRFLDCGKFVPISRVIPFSVGKRACLGEALARMELFIFFSTLMQHLEVSLGPGEKDRLADIFEGTKGIVHAPMDHKLVFRSRDN